LTYELVYLAAFLDIVAVEFKRIKHDNTWFETTKGMQIKIANVLKNYFNAYFNGN